MHPLFGRVTQRCFSVDMRKGSLRNKTKQRLYRRLFFLSKCIDEAGLQIIIKCYHSKNLWNSRVVHKESVILQLWNSHCLSFLIIMICMQWSTLRYCCVTLRKRVRTGKFFCHQKILHLETALETGSMDQPVQRHNFPAFLPRLIYSLYS